MTSLLGTAALLTPDGDACKSWYLHAGCHRFARPLGSHKIVRPDEPPSSLLSNSYESRMGTQLGKPTLDKTPRYVVFYIFCILAITLLFDVTYYIAYSTIL